MSFATLSLGERIVLAARIAAEAHLQSSPQISSGREQDAGGAGCAAITDDPFSPSLRRAHPRAPLAEGVAG